MFKFKCRFKYTLTRRSHASGYGGKRAHSNNPPRNSVPKNLR
jgi:hypothetical protein